VKKKQEEDGPSFVPAARGGKGTRKDSKQVLSWNLEGESQKWKEPARLSVEDYGEGETRK